MLITLEAIRRKPLSLKLQEQIQTAGIVLILGLMLYVTWNDLDRDRSDLYPLDDA